MKRFWIFFLLTGLVYAAMATWTMPRLVVCTAQAPDGTCLSALLPLDGRWFGYGVAEARAYVAALSPVQNALYRHGQHLLDLIFPALIAASFLSGFRALAPRPLRRPACAVALVGAAADYLENGLIHLLLLGRASDAMIRLSSAATLVKTLSVLLCALLLIALALRYLRRPRQQGPAA